jgi:putative intracellular protease/amidase
MPPVDTRLVGKDAIGAIGPGPRVEDGEIDGDVVEELAARLEGDELFVPIGDEFGPCAAGGTFTLVAADALTTGRFYTSGDSAADHAKKVYRWLLDNKDDTESRTVIPRVCIDGRVEVEGPQNDTVVGGHLDCGALKKLKTTLGLIADGDAVRAFLAKRGVEVDDDTHRLMTSRAQMLLESGYADGEAEEGYEAFRETAGEAAVPALQGEHTEVVGVANYAEGVTLNRKKERDEFGDTVSAFNLDVAPLSAASEIMALTPEEAHQKFVAALYFNVGTELALCHGSLRTVDHR